MSVVVAVGVEILDYIFNDEKTMHDLVGGIGVEAAKAGLATMVGMSIGTGMIVAGVTTIAILPLSLMVAAVFLSSFVLNKIDENWKIKKTVIEALKISTDNTNPGIYRINTNAIASESFNSGCETIESSAYAKNLLTSISRKN